MGIKFKNGAVSILTGSLTTISTDILINAADDGLFPVIAAIGADYFYLTLEDKDHNIEVVKIVRHVSGSNNLETDGTADSGVNRGLDGTMARSWAIGDVVELRPNAKALEEMDFSSDAELAAIAGLASAADRLPYFTGLGTAALATFTAVARTLIAQATQALMRTTLGVSRSGTITMYRTGNGTWEVANPDGTLVDISASTTDGLQEAINEAAKNAYTLVIEGGALKPAVFPGPYGGTLGNNPIATTNGSGVITISHTAHGRSTGMKFRFSGSSAVNGINANQINDITFPITVLGADSYTVITAGTATSTGSGGGASVVWQDYPDPVGEINCTTGIVLPPLQSVHWFIRDVILNFQPTVTGTMLFIDSCIMTQLDFTGFQIVGTGNRAVEVKPTNRFPHDPGGPGITASRFRLGTVGAGTGPGVVVFDPSLGGIADSFWEFTEVNAGTVGLLVKNPGAGKNFANNHIRATNIHGQDGAHIQVGESSITSIKGNTWMLNCGAAGPPLGLDTWAVQDIYILSLNTAATVGIKLESSADQNVIIAPVNGATTPLQDLSLTKNNKILSGDNRKASVHRNAVDQTAVAQNAFAKVQFTTETYDDGAGFDAVTNYRFTPGAYAIGKKVRVSARVAWKTTADQAKLYTACIQSGSELKIAMIVSSGSGTNQGAILTTTMNITSVTDYFEIHARQDNVDARDINGTSTETWATFEVVD